MAKLRVKGAAPTVVKQEDKQENPWGQWKLFVTTAGAVFVWDYQKFYTVFTSGSDGIAAAKRAKDGSVLAIADAHVVILHKVEKGQNRSYKLKGADGLCRLLEYAPDGRSLFFTSTIQNSVHTYSIREDRISETHKIHPSPITTFAASSDASLLLSTSVEPPTIHIENATTRTSTVFKPKVSSAAVLVSAFHPSRKSIFLLGFADGTLTAFDHTKLNKGQNIHSFGHLHDSTNGSTGLVAAEFIPGYPARAVTVGGDGRLFVVDFEKKDVIGSYAVGAPVTSLCLRTLSASGVRNGGSSKGVSPWFAAVGTVHGWCYIFDHEGNQIHAKLMDDEGGEVLNVEWVFGEVNIPPTTGLLKRKQIGENSPAKKDDGNGKAAKIVTPEEEPADEPVSKKQKSIRAPLRVAPKRPAVAMPSVISNASSTPKRLMSSKTPKLAKPQDSLQPAWEKVTGSFDESYMDLFSPVKGNSLASYSLTAVNEVNPAQPVQVLEAPRRRSTRLSTAATEPIPSAAKKLTTNLDHNEKMGRLIEQAASGNYRNAISSPQLSDFTIETQPKQLDIPVKSPTKSAIPTPIKTMIPSSTKTGLSSPLKAGPSSSIQTATKPKASSVLMDEQSAIAPPSTRTTKATATAMTRSAPATKPTDTTTDAAMLRGIQALRAKFEEPNTEGKKPRNGLALFRPFMSNPNVVKSTAINHSRDGEEKENDGEPVRSDKRVEKKKTKKGEEQGKRQKERADKKTRLRRARSRSHSSERSEQDISTVGAADVITPAPQGFDIWESQVTPEHEPSSAGKKRKQTPADEPVQKSTSSGSSSRSDLRAALDRGGSSKLRKTVAFEEEAPAPPRENRSQAFKPAQTSVSISRSAAASSAIVQSTTSNMATLQSTPDGTLQRYLDDMKDRHHNDAQTMQIEMLKQFQAQRKYLEDTLKQERREKDELKQELGEVKGMLSELLEIQKKSQGYGF